MSKIIFLGLFSILISTPQSFAKHSKEKHAKATKADSSKDQALLKKIKALPSVQVESTEKHLVYKLLPKNKVEITDSVSGEKHGTGTWDVKKGFLLINYGSGKERERIRYLAQLKSGKLLINQRAGEDGHWKVDSQPQAVKDNQIIKDVPAAKPSTKGIKETKETKEVPAVQEVESESIDLEE